MHITFPKEWKTNNIYQLFNPFGNLLPCYLRMLNNVIITGPVHIAWIDDQSAYVGLQKQNQLSVALKTLSQSDTYKIMTYNKHQAIKQGLIDTQISSNVTPKKHFLEEQECIKKRKISSGELVLMIIILILTCYVFEIHIYDLSNVSRWFENL